jgi:hypothetical protein
LRPIALLRIGYYSGWRVLLRNILERLFSGWNNNILFMGWASHAHPEVILRENQNTGNGFPFRCATPNNAHATYHCAMCNLHHPRPTHHA